MRKKENIFTPTSEGDWARAIPPMGIFALFGGKWSIIYCNHLTLQ